MRARLDPPVSVIQMSWRRAIRLRYWRLLAAMAMEEEGHRQMLLRHAAASLIIKRYRQYQHRMYVKSVKLAETFLQRRMGALRREEQVQREAEERAKQVGESVLDKLEREKRKRGKVKGGQEDQDARSRKEARDAEKRGMAFAIYQNQRRAVNAGERRVRVCEVVNVSGGLLCGRFPCCSFTER